MEIRDDPVLVTWVPQFCNVGNVLNVKHVPSMIDHTDVPHLFLASGSTQAISPDEHDWLLAVQGIKVGVIVKRTDPPGHMVSGTGQNALGPGTAWDGPWHSFARDNATNSIYAPTDEPIDFAFQRLCIWDSMPDEGVYGRRSRKGPLTYIPPVSPLSYKQSKAGVWKVFGPKHSIGEAVLKATVRKRMFVTDSGYLGIAHRSLQIGDQVWILMGADMPCILRSISSETSGSEPGKYLFGGESYVHGIMDGEFLIEAARKGRPDVAPETFDKNWLETLHMMTPEYPFPTKLLMLM